MGKIRATDDEQLARQLWGDAKRWDDELKQYVPVDSAVDVDLGNVDAPVEDGGVGYEFRTTVELRDELRARQLSTHGTKAELIQRLVDSDADAS